MLMLGHNRQDQHWQLIPKRESTVRSESSKSHVSTKQDFLRTTADTDKKERERERERERVRERKRERGRESKREREREREDERVRE